MKPESGAVLIISPEPWDHIFVSKHHYAITLAQLGFKVFFLNPPGKATGLRLTPLPQYSGVVLVDYSIRVRGQRFLPGFISRWLDRSFLNRLEQASGCQFQAIWSFDNSRFYDLRFARKRIKIYHQVDFVGDYHTAIAASTADVCLCVNKQIYSKVARYNPNTYVVPHGVTSAALTDLSLVTNHIENGKVKATYIGNLDIPFIDWQLIRTIVSANPSIFFQFAGGFSAGGPADKLSKEFSNVKLLGRLDSRDIPSLLRKSDVLLVCYRSEEFPEQLASTHKMMEYLGSGKVVVATNTESLSNHKSLLAMAETNDRYPTLFQQVVSDLHHYNSADAQKLRIKYAQSQTYGQHIIRIFDLINIHGS